MNKVLVLVVQWEKFELFLSLFSFADLQLLDDSGIPTSQFLNVCRELVPFFGKSHYTLVFVIVIVLTLRMVVWPCRMDLCGTPDCPAVHHTAQQYTRLSHNKLDQLGHTEKSCRMVQKQAGCMGCPMETVLKKKKSVPYGLAQNICITYPKMAAL